MTVSLWSLARRVSADFPTILNLVAVVIVLFVAQLHGLRHKILNTVISLAILL